MTPDGRKNMDGEWFDGKVKSMPQELQDSFRNALELSASKKIVNRFKNVVMQAYAQGQRDAMKSDNYSRGYSRGADDMAETVRTILLMDRDEHELYFEIPRTINDTDRLFEIMSHDSNFIFSVTAGYKAKKNDAGTEAVRKLADEIGINKLYSIVRDMRGEG